MKKRFTFLTAALMLLVFMMPSMAGWGQTATYSLTPNASSTGLSNTTYITTLTEFNYNGVSWKMNQWNPSTLQIKCNQSSAASEFRFYNTSAIPGRITQVVITFSALTVSDASKLMFLGGTTEVSATTGGTAGTWNSTDKTLTWTPGTSDNFTFFAFYQNGKAASGTNYLASTDAIVVTYETGGGSLEQSDLAITGAPVVLSFDLYNNSSSQTVSYTTSSTGAVTVSGGTGYVTTSLNTGSKTVTVTPTAVTPSAQTITISQAADATYAAGSKTFTVSVTDSTPFEGVIFDAAEDTGTSPIVKDGVSFACTSGVLDNSSEYRLYKNSITTFSTTDEKSKITKIEFTGVSGNPASGFASQEGWTTSGNDGTWAGNKTSVSFTASGAQVRATKIKVWVTWAPSISADNVNIAYNTTSGSIAYTLNHGADGSSVTATKITGDWLTVGDVGDESVAFTCSANNTSIDRTATVRLTYSEDEDINTVVTVTQSGAPTYTVTYDSNGGTGTMNDLNSPYMAGATVTLLSNEFTKSGYIFNDWSISPNVTVTNNQFTMPASNVTVTAQWTAKVITGLSYTGTPNKTSYYDGEYFDPTGLTITASYSNADDENVTSSVEWTPSPLTNGTTSVTGTYMGRTINVEGLTVTYAPGSVNNPYTVTQALDAELPANNVYVRGVISSITEVSTTYNNATYTITDGDNTMDVFRGKYLNNANFTNASQIQIGDPVVVYGNLANNNSVNRLAQGNYLVSLKHTVTYHINNGSGSETQAVQVEHGTAHTVIAKPDEWTYPGNTKLFVQWNTQDDGEGDDYTPDASLTVNENTDLYAVWDNNVWIISYTTNGVAEATTTNVIKGQTISGLLASPAQVVPAGYTFVGWSETEVTLGNTPTFVNNGDAISRDLPLFAVFATATIVEQEQDCQYIMEADHFQTGSYAANDGTNVTINGQSLNIKDVYKNSGIQFKANSGCLYNNNALGNRIVSIVIEVTNNTFNVYEGSSSGPTSSVTSSGSGSTKTYTFSTQNNNAYFKIKSTSSYAKASQITVNYKATVEVADYANYCTSVSDAIVAITDGTISAGHLTTNGTIASDAAVYITTPLTINSNVTLTVNGVLANDNPANLIIEDGGQLILSDDASVQATVKNSTAASTETKTYDIQWNAISSPVDNVVVTSFVKGDTHNVYRYDEKTVYWQEYRGTNGFNNLQNGRGYIYRSTESGIEFQGEVITGTVSCADYLSYACDNNRYIGFNLIGNPFTHDITWSNLTTKTNISSAGFFLLGADGNWSAQTNSGTIAPMQAFLVQATEESPVIKISNTAGKGDDRYGNDQIQFTVNNSEYSDVAYAIFREGHGLNKIEHRNDNIPMLYIINDDKDYAIAEMPDNTNVINLGFKARAIGQYTLSLNAEGRYSYMHLYDKLTGSDVDMLLDNSYTFVGSPSDRNDRFVLRLNYNAANIDTESDIFAYQNGADIIISGTGELQIFDIMGHQISTQRINGVETINVSTQGVYILRLVGTEIKTQKIVVR